MNPELLAKLLKWLTSDDPVERAHAEWRLAQPDVLTPTPQPVVTPIEYVPRRGCCG